MKKLKIGTRLKARHDFANNFHKDEKYTITKVSEGTGTPFLIDDVVEFDSATIFKNFKILKKKIKSKEIVKEDIKYIHKKRVLYSWMKNKQSRSFKYMLAHLADKAGYEQINSGKAKFNNFAKKITEDTISLFPSMFNEIRSFYKANGRELTLKEFKNIATMRLTCMVMYDKEVKKVIILPEHPSQCPDKFADVSVLCSKIIKKKGTYDSVASNA